MDTKEKIKVLIIENNKNALGDLERVLKMDERYELVSKRNSARDSTKMEKTRADQKKEIWTLLEPIDYQILILDLLLRDKTEIEPELVGEDFAGCEKILSVEVANELKMKDEFADIMIVFTSSSRICHTHERFEKMRSAFPDLIPPDSVFLFKPGSDAQEIWMKACPVYRKDNKGECGTESGIKTCNRTQGQCFLAVLGKYYKDFRKGKGYEE